MTRDMITLDSAVDIVGSMPRFGQEAIADERSLAWSTLEYAAEEGGEITRAFLAALPAEWRAADVAVQVKMSRLERGDAAGPLGFHCDWLATDAVGRRTDPNQQWPQGVAVVVGDCAPTRFIEGRLELPAAPTQADQAREWEPLIRNAIAAGRAKEIVVEPSTLFRFGPCSLHGRSPASFDGWRGILRAKKTPGRKPFIWNCTWEKLQSAFRARMARGAIHGAPGVAP
ncbi:MAG: hypothetical protein AAF628_00040 [Planctomycetota bacterium]